MSRVVAGRECFLPLSLSFLLNYPLAGLDIMATTLVDRQAKQAHTRFPYCESVHNRNGRLKFLPLQSFDSLGEIKRLITASQQLLLLLFHSEPEEDCQQIDG